jgi:hypothetical protein|tara:strand:- start:8 stop:349 length:342 start_codon:yes stop_codon:yes gene_type:complete
MQLQFIKLSSILLLLLSFSVYANDVTVTVITSEGGTFNVLQDGEDNDVDFDIQSMNGFNIDLDQIGDNNVIDIDVDGRTSNGSSMTINQNGNNKSFSGSYYCGHSSCSMTVNQ